jgi:amino acid transporter
MDILLYGGSLILEFVALIVLRMKQPELARPFRIPGGTLGAIAIAAGPCILLVLAAALNRNEKIGSIGAATLAVGITICGVVIYPLARKLCASK